MSQSKIKLRKQPPHAPPQVHLDAAALKAAADQFSRNITDNSPAIDNAIAEQVLIEVAGLNLSNLAAGIRAAGRTIPHLDQLFASTTHIETFPTEDAPRHTAANAQLAAIAFEAGRRYGILIAMQLLSEEVDTFSAERIDDDKRTILAQ